MTRYTSLSALLEELSPELPATGPGWADVLIRADALAAGSNGSAGRVRPLELRTDGARRGRRRSRFVIALALIALLGVVVAATYALGHPIIDFGKASKSSRTVVNVFGRMTVMATPTDVLPHQARTITVVRINGVDHSLSVAPVKSGGFCFEWSGVIATCQSRTPPLVPSAMNWTPGPGGLLWMGTSSKNGTVSLIGGSLLARSATQLIIKYRDGESDQIPFVWVTAPINAGFFLFAVPEKHQQHDDPPTSITLLDSAQHPIETQRFAPLTAAPPVIRRYHLRRLHLHGYAPVSVPVQAEWQKRRQLLRLTTNGVRTGLWVAPKRGGGTCFWTYGIGGCSTPRQPLHPPVAGTLWLRVKRVSHYVVVCCTVARNVQRVVAHFQDGDRTALRVIDGFVLWPIPKRHYEPGHRLDELLGYNTRGAEVGIALVSPHIRALYPCSKPKNYGYGLVMCP